MTLNRPEWIAALLLPETYKSNTKKIRLVETSSSYLFKADNLIYKIKKFSNEYSTLAIKEAFCYEECKLSKRFNHDWDIEVIASSDF